MTVRHLAVPAYTVPAVGGGIAFGSISNTTWASRTNTTITAPTGITNGDFLLFQILTGANGDAPDPTPPGGLTAIGTATDATDPGSFNVESRAYYKIASSEAGDYTFTHTSASSQGYCIRYTGVNTTTPLDATATQTGSGSTDTITATGITTVTANTMLVFLEHDWGDGAGFGSTPPTGMTERLDVVLSYAADVIQTSAGASGNKTHTGHVGGGQWAARLIALRPA